MKKNSLLSSTISLVSDVYTPSQKSKFTELVYNILSTDSHLLDNSSIMGDETKKAKKTSAPPTLIDESKIVNLNENDLFMELIKDISNELDINILCHKILRNVSLLTNSDRGSLFLTKGTKDMPILISTLYDVTEKSTLEESVHSSENAIVIPWGKGIAGIVAATKEPINIKNAYEDKRFNPDVDKKTGFRTYAILCMPIMNYEEEVVGVAQIINKRKGKQEFTSKDQEVFRKYMIFCGIGIQNARLFQISIQEYKRNKLLLKLARNIFEQQNTLDQLVPKIMRDTQEIIKAECAIYIIHRDVNINIPFEKSRELLQQTSSTSYMSHIQFSPVFKLITMDDDDYEIKKLKPEEFQNLPETQIAIYVVANGETLNIHNGKSDTEDLENIILIPTDAPLPKNILTVPIMNNEHIVFGAVQFIHKLDQNPFEESDIALIEAFALFCGLGINNTSMYENVVKLIAKQNVALEVLSYHATASFEEAKRIKSQMIPAVRKLSLNSYAFDDKDMSDDETILASLSMFYHLNLPSKFNIPLEILSRWALSVKKNYRPVTYHNWRHAFNVAQVMFCILTTGGLEKHFTDLEILSFMIACLCHDLDHRGTNNAFMSKADTSLAKVYGTSTLEHHHFDQCVMILSSPGNTILQSLSPNEYKKCIDLLENYILATDLAIYFKRRPSFIELVNNGEREFNDPEDHNLLSSMMMTSCDIAAITKPWSVQERIGILVAKEFFEQGDIEKKKLHMKPLPLMDRDKSSEMPKMQVDFINVVCLPLYEALAKLDDKLRPILQGVLDNKARWQKLSTDPNFDINSFHLEPKEDKKNETNQNTSSVIKSEEGNIEQIPLQNASELDTDIYNHNKLSSEGEDDVNNQSSNNKDLDIKNIKVEKIHKLRHHPHITFKEPGWSQRDDEFYKKKHLNENNENGFTDSNNSDEIFDKSNSSKDSDKSNDNKTLSESDVPLDNKSMGKRDSIQIYRKKSARNLVQAIFPHKNNQVAGLNYNITNHDQTNYNKGGTRMSYRASIAVDKDINEYKTNLNNEKIRSNRERRPPRRSLPNNNYISKTLAGNRIESLEVLADEENEKVFDTLLNDDDERLNGNINVLTRNENTKNSGERIQDIKQGEISNGLTKESKNAIQEISKESLGAYKQNDIQQNLTQDPNSNNLQNELKLDLNSNTNQINNDDIDQNILPSFSSIHSTKEFPQNGNSNSIDNSPERKDSSRTSNENESVNSSPIKRGPKKTSLFKKQKKSNLSLFPDENNDNLASTSSLAINKQLPSGDDGYQSNKNAETSSNNVRSFPPHRDSLRLMHDKEPYKTKEQHDEKLFSEPDINSINNNGDGDKKSMMGSKVHFESLIYKPRNPPPGPLDRYRNKKSGTSKICIIL
ncbi:cGMP-specific 3',5'-cyclic phosphodiesterase-like isoform X3 [Gordionus sp. m RMFG-2023]|uniref:cGMP-specific 3',5'-cyclic phosphodiesterase-like isoform X3 n=1 Tax=Gordionus sp. m RMFG-2023 TaxID=3053472 RepID=UPI0031FC09FB